MLGRLFIKVWFPAFLPFIVGATEKATGFIVATVGGITLTAGGVSIFNATIVGGVTGIFIVGAPGALGSLTLTFTLGGTGLLGVAIVIPIFGTAIVPGALGGVIDKASIVTFFILGKVILGASIGLFGFGSTLGAVIVLTSGPFMSNGSTFLLTSFGEIRASISTSLVGSFKFNKPTNPQFLFPFVDEFIAVFFSIFTPPFDVLLAFFQEASESFPGVNGAPLTFWLSRESIAFFSFQSPLVYTPLKRYFWDLSPLPLYTPLNFSLK